MIQYVHITELHNMYEGLNLMIASIQKNFDQPGFKMYCNLQELLLKATKRIVMMKNMTM